MAVNDPAAVEVVGRHLDAHAVAREDADAVAAHLAGHVGQDLVAVVELHPEHRVRERLDDLPSNSIFSSLAKLDDPYVRGLGPVGVSPGSYSSLPPPASARKPSRATTAWLSRDGSGGDGIGSLVSPLTRRSARSEVPLQPSAKLHVEHRLGQAAGASVQQPRQDSSERHEVRAGVGHASTSLRQTGPAARPTRSRRQLTLTAEEPRRPPGRCSRPRRCGHIRAAPKFGSHRGGPPAFDVGRAGRRGSVALDGWSVLDGDRRRSVAAHGPAGEPDDRQQRRLVRRARLTGLGAGACSASGSWRASSTFASAWSRRPQTALPRSPRFWRSLRDSLSDSAARSRAMLARRRISR